MRPLRKSSYVLDVNRLERTEAMHLFQDIGATFVLASEQPDARVFRIDVIPPPGHTPQDFGVDAAGIQIGVPVDTIRFPHPYETRAMLDLPNIRIPLRDAMCGGPKLVVLSSSL